MVNLESPKTLFITKGASCGTRRNRCSWNYCRRNHGSNRDYHRINHHPVQNHQRGEKGSRESVTGIHKETRKAQARRIHCPINLKQNYCPAVEDDGSRKLFRFSSHGSPGAVGGRDLIDAGGVFSKYDINSLMACLSPNRLPVYRTRVSERLYLLIALSPSCCRLIFLGQAKQIWTDQMSGYTSIGRRFNLNSPTCWHPSLFPLRNRHRRDPQSLSQNALPPEMFNCFIKTVHSASINISFITLQTYCLLLFCWTSVN